MSASNVVYTLSNVVIPYEITALATYNQGTLPVYLFIGNVNGGLYIYDFSYGTQKQFSISGVAITTPITGLAVSDAYLFVNSPGNCYQLPLFSFYPTTAYTSLSVVNVGNCYTRDTANEGGIAVLPDNRTLFVSYGLEYLSKVYTSDSGNGLAVQVADIPRAYDAFINGVTIDIPNTTIYISDSKNARMYYYKYLKGSNSTLSNIYFAGDRGVEFRGNAYSSYSGTLAYVVTNACGQSGVFGVQTQTNAQFVMAPSKSLCNTNALAYDTFGGLYMSTMRSDGFYTIKVNRYSYTPRPVPSVAPPRQQQYACGLILPGSCKRAYQAFNGRERFGWGSPNKPYRTLSLQDTKVSCPPAYVDVCPNFSIAEGTTPLAPTFRQAVIPPPNAGASVQDITRSRNLSTTRVASLNSNATATFPSPITATSPSIDYLGRIYVGSTSGYLYYSDTLNSPVSNFYIGGTIVASPACSQSDRKLVVGTLQGTLTALDGATGSVIWQKNLGEALNNTPAYVDNAVFVAYGKQLSAFRATDGSTVWSAPSLSNGDTYSSSINVQAGNVFVGTNSGTLYSYNQTDGSTILYYPAKTGPILGSPNLGIYNRVYFGSGKNLFGVNLDRTQSSTDIVYTNIVGNITTGITLAVNIEYQTLAFFSTSSNNAYCVQADTNTGVYAQNVASNSLPVLDISYMYVMGTTGIVWRYEWNPLNFSVSLSYATGSVANFGPSILINTSNEVIVAMSNAILTLS